MLICDYSFGEQIAIAILMALTIFIAIVAAYYGKKVINFFSYKIMMAKEKRKAKKETNSRWN